MGTAMLQRARELDAKVERILTAAGNNVALFGFRKTYLRRIICLKDCFNPLMTPAGDPDRMLVFGPTEKLTELGKGIGKVSHLPPPPPPCFKSAMKETKKKRSSNDPSPAGDQVKEEAKTITSFPRDISSFPFPFLSSSLLIQYNLRAARGRYAAMSSHTT